MGREFLARIELDPAKSSSGPNTTCILTLPDTDPPVDEDNLLMNSGVLIITLVTTNIALEAVLPGNATMAGWQAFYHS